MHKRYFHQNELDYNRLFQGSKEEEFQTSFKYVFSKKESLDDIKLDNKLYFNNRKSYDITRNTTNIKERKDYDIHSTNSIKNRNKLLPLKKEKENQISYKDKVNDTSYINYYNENSVSYINKSHEQTHLIRDKKETTTNIDENENNLIIQTKNKTKIWIRCPYKQKNKIIKKIKTNDKFFPFTSGNGIIKFESKDYTDKDKDNNKNSKKNIIKNFLKQVHFLLIQIKN